MNTHHRIWGALTISFFGFFALVLPQTAMAEFSGTGSGTQADPYVITTCDHLQSIPSNSGDYFELGGNVDCSETNAWNAGAGFDPIDNFYGYFDGNDYAITGLFIDRSDHSYVGLFGSLSGDVYNVTFLAGDSGSISGGTTTSHGAGTVAGYLSSSGDIADVHSNMTIVGTGDVGGLFGQSNYNRINNVSFTGEATGNVVGGVIGRVYYYSTLENAKVNATLSGASVGGIYGTVQGNGNGQPFEAAYATGTFTGSTAVGGLIGDLSNGHSLNITNSFSAATLAGAGTKGGIVGDANSLGQILNNVYFDSNEAGTTDCVGADAGGFSTLDCSTWDSSSDATYLKGNSTDEPLDQWDFDNDWEVASGAFPNLVDLSDFGAPGAPMDATATYDSENSEFDLSWTVPTSTGGFPLTGYRVQLQLAGGDWSSLLLNTTTSNTTYSVSTFFVNTDYEFRVAAINTLGTGSYDDGDFSYTPAASEISSCTELLAIDDVASNVNKIFELTQDIDCTGVDFDGIGAGEWSEFRGYFDGKGYTISNITIDEVRSNLGVFARLNNATITDVTFSGISVNSNSGSNVGALAGRASNAVISDITLSDIDIDGGGETGGLIGYVSMGENYVFQLSGVHILSGTVDGTSDSVGGLVGDFYMDDGGVATITETRSLVDVTSTADYVGGLIGYLNSEYGGQITISKVYTDGTISADSYAGGLFGRIEFVGDNEEAIVTITDAYSVADVSAEYDVGGFIGHGEVEDDGENARMIIQNSYAAGTVTGTGEDEDVAGFIGHSAYAEDEEDEYIQIDDSFAAAVVTTNEDDYVGGFFGDSDGDEDGMLYTNLYWDVTRSGRSNCDGADDLSEGECTGVSGNSGYFYSADNEPFAGSWDTENTWYFSGTAYPQLRTFSPQSANFSNVQVEAHSTTADISWNTDKAASTMVTYGPSTAFGKSTTEKNTVTRVTSHSQSLVDLEPCTKYFYYLTGTTAFPTTSTSTRYDFITDGCTTGDRPRDTTVQAVTDAGGTVTQTNSGTSITLTFPENYSLEYSSLVIQVKSFLQSSLAALGTPTGKTEAGNIAFDVTALIDETTILDTFDAPISFVLTYSDADLTQYGVDESTLTMYRYHNGTFTEMDDCQLDTDANTLTCSTESFSMFGVYADAVTAQDSDDSDDESDNTEESEDAVTVSSVTGAKRGKIKVTYSDNTVVRHTVFGKAKNAQKKTKVKQYNSTDWYMVLKHNATHVAFVNTNTGVVTSNVRLSQRWKHNADRMFLTDLRSEDDSHQELVVVSKGPKRVRVSIVRVNYDSKRLQRSDRVRLLSSNIQLKKTVIKDKRIRLRNKNGHVLLDLSVGKKLKMTNISEILTH